MEKFNSISTGRFPMSHQSDAGSPLSHFQTFATTVERADLRMYVSAILWLTRESPNLTLQWPFLDSSCAPYWSELASVQHTSTLL